MTNARLMEVVASADLAAYAGAHEITVQPNGTPDAFWNYNLTVWRMDEADRVDSPQWLASWNWGGIVYWAVSEAQARRAVPKNIAHRH